MGQPVADAFIRFYQIKCCQGACMDLFMSTDIRFVHGYFYVYGHFFCLRTLSCLWTLLCLRTLRVCGHTVSADTLCLRALLVCGHLPPGTLCLRALSVSKDTRVYGHTVYGHLCLQAPHWIAWTKQTRPFDFPLSKKN